MGTYACVKWGKGWSDCFGLYAGVRQRGVLSPVLFNISIYTGYMYKYKVLL